MTKRVLTIAAIAAISFGVVGVAPAHASCGSDDDFVFAEYEEESGPSWGVYRGGDSPTGVYVAADTRAGVSYCSDGTFEDLPQP